MSGYDKAKHAVKLRRSPGRPSMQNIAQKTWEADLALTSSPVTSITGSRLGACLSSLVKKKVQGWGGEVVEGGSGGGRQNQKGGGRV